MPVENKDKKWKKTGLQSNMPSLGSFLAAVALIVCAVLGLYSESTHGTPFSTRIQTVFQWHTSKNQLRSSSRKRELALSQDPRSVAEKQSVRHSKELDAALIEGGVLEGGHTLDTHVPSYVHLCRALLERKDYNEISTQYVVHESEEVCLSPNSFQSLVTMMISAMISSVGAAVKVSYVHRCTTPLNIHGATIQQLLPAKLSMSLEFTFNEIIDRCSMCLNQPSSTSMVECFGFPVLGQASTPDQAARIIPHFRENIKTAVNKVRHLEAIDRSAATKGVTIYLDSETELGTNVSQIPMKHYAEIIPRDVETISIIVAEHCSNCHDLSDMTKDYLRRLYPTAQTDVEVVDGSALAYERVIDAACYICSPSTFCLLPSLFKNLSHSSYLVSHPWLHPWFNLLAENQLNKSVFLEDKYALTKIGGSREESELASIFESVKDTNDEMCLKLRGRIGEWKKDMEYARSAQYVKNLFQFSKFDYELPPEMPYRDATTFRWHDDLCPVQLLERQGFCSLMENLGLTRVYFVGDSLAMQMVQSFWKLLGHEKEPFFMNKNITYHRYQFNATVECPNHQRGFEIVYTRNDLIDNNDETDLHKRTGDKDYNCGEDNVEFCMPWIRSFSEYQGGGTLLIANVGPHVHTMEEFQRLSENFLGLVDAHQKQNDIVLFRTTPPGHKNCQDPNIAPIRTYDEFMEKHFVSDHKSYQLFPLFNRFVEQCIRMRQRDNLQVLDVVPMTVLRPDGHISGPQKCAAIPCAKTNDCLHYILPGPPDFWNHLMFSNLVTTAALRAKSAIGREATSRGLLTLHHAGDVVQQN